MESIRMKTQFQLQRMSADAWLPKPVTGRLADYVRNWIATLAKIFIGGLVLSANSLAEVATIEDLPPSKLVGVWEAIIQRNGVVGPGVYQMHFTTPSSAYFVAVWPGASRPLFVGRLVSSEIVKGRLKLVFAPIDASESDYDSVEIGGRANYSGDEGGIDGKIIIKARNGRVSTDPVIFLNRLWTQSISEASDSAQKAIQNAENPQPSPSRN
jgi:hypothetical protein